VRLRGGGRREGRRVEVVVAADADAVAGPGARGGGRRGRVRVVRGRRRHGRRRRRRRGRWARPAEGGREVSGGGGRWWWRGRRGGSAAIREGASGFGNRKWRGGRGLEEDGGTRGGGRGDGLLYSEGGARHLAAVGSDTAAIDLASPFRWLSFRILKFGGSKLKRLPGLVGHPMYFPLLKFGGDFASKKF
jgi:hypothetical protein